MTLRSIWHGRRRTVCSLLPSRWSVPAHLLLFICQSYTCFQVHHCSEPFSCTECACCVKEILELKSACAEEESCSIVIDMCTLSEGKHITAHGPCDHRLGAVRFLRRVGNLTSHLHAQSPKHDVATELISSMYDQRRMPHFLSNAAPDAEVHSGFLDILDNFQQDQDGREPLADTVKELTGELLFLWLCNSSYAAGQ